MKRPFGFCSPNRRDYIRHVIFVLADVIDITRCAPGLAVTAQVESDEFGSADIAQHLGTAVEGSAFRGDAVQQQDGVIRINRKAAGE